MNSDRKQSEAKINDCIRLCEKYSSARFTSFFTEEEQSDCADIVAYGVNTAFFGGYEAAGRKLFGAFPDWQEPVASEYPISVISVEKKYKKELSHRDYLGTVLSLGVERDAVGDILVHDDGAYIFVLNSISDALLFGLDKVAGCGVRTKSVLPGDITILEQEFEDLFCIAASMRLDAVVAAAAKLSRQKAAELIKSAKVMLNHRETADVSKTVVAGDTLSLRGFGKYIVQSVNGRTGSGRLHVHIKKFR